jgi:hypothetical protein
MEILIGAGLAAVTCLLATFARFDRERAFYPVLTLVVASYYILFAVMGSSMAALAGETVVFAAFLLAAVAGFRRNLWLVAIALAAHGLLDSIHGRILSNPGVPAWWPMFCLSFDVVAAAYLAWLLATHRRPA